MSISKDSLAHLAKLAYLKSKPETEAELCQEVNQILDFAESLRKLDLSGVDPLFHPMELSQPLRPDEISEKECLSELEAIATHFSSGLYWVPKVIDSNSSDDV